MIQIHNFYSDLLLSIRSLFDTQIFSSNFIKHYSFNIANRTFELSKRDYKPNRALPAIIINLLTEEYTFGERPTNISQSKLPNINQIPVLYDQESNNIIYTQEEHTTVSINVNINCESQFQAKEVEFHVKRFLPLTKYTNILSFTSFLEINNQYLLDIGIDPNDRQITNLFVKLNKNLGRLEYCYSMFYNPSIRLDSIDSSISTSSQQSFTVSLTLSLMIQVPLYIFSEKETGTIERINVDFTRIGNDPITINSTRSFIKDTNDYLLLSESTKNIKANLLLFNLLEDNNLTSLTVNDIDYKLFEVYIPEKDLVLQENFIFRIFDIRNQIHDITPTLIDTDINTVKFQVTDEDYQNYYNASLTTPIILQIIENLE
jgi:hypothetical protein